MTRGVHLLNRVVLAVLGVLLIAVAGVLAAAGSGASGPVGRVGALWPDAADAVRADVAALAASASPTAVTVAGAVAAAVLALLAFAWVGVQRRGRARTGIVRPAAAGGDVPGEVVVTAAAVEGLVHGLVRRSDDVVGASVGAVRRGRADRRAPRYDVVVAPRRGADPVVVATAAGSAAEAAGRLLGVPVDRTLRLRASPVRRRLAAARRVG